VREQRIGLARACFEPMFRGMDHNSSDGDPCASLLSFVIPAHNEEAVLAETLRALDRAAREVGEPFEVVVAADSCTDRTPEIAREHGARVVEVAYRQISRTRNAGAAATHGERLIFIDADTRVTPELIAAALGALDAGALGGGAHVVFEGQQRLGVRLLVGSFMWILHRLRIAPGCFFFCRRADFEALGGFGRDEFAGEEIWLSRAFQRRGSFVALDEEVLTSSRKIRTHSACEILAAFLRPLWKGRAAFRARAGLGLWYSERRPDPDDGRT
jgi:glycosyltransferase involved in cell wall biosynthesis